MKFFVKIIYSRGFGPDAYLQHDKRSSWGKSQAYKHARDIRQGKTGIRNFTSVVVEKEQNHEIL